MGLKYPHSGSHWTSYWNYSLCLSVRVWRILIHATLFLIIIRVVITISEVFESFLNLISDLVYRRIIVWVIDIILTSFWFCSYFPPSYFQTIFLFLESITFAHELWLALSFHEFSLFIPRDSRIIVLFFIIITYLQLINPEFFGLDAEFDCLCFEDHFLFYHGFFFRFITHLILFWRNLATHHISFLFLNAISFNSKEVPADLLIFARTLFLHWPILYQNYLIISLICLHIHCIYFFSLSIFVLIKPLTI